jgi:hypothetical protein
MDELSARPDKVRAMLYSLVVDPDSRRTPGFIHCQSAPAFDRRQHVLAVHDGLPTDVSDYQSWRFSTYRRGFRCQYFEIWTAVDDRFFVYELYKAYLTLSRIYSRPLREDKLLALHCDPSTEDSERHAFYKQGPHIHLDAAKYPLSRAHIALNRGHLPQVLASADSLSDEIGAAVTMLKEEVLTLSWPAVA